MSLKDIPPSINTTASLMGLPAHLDAFQLAPAATTTEFASAASAGDAPQPNVVSPSQQAFSEAVSALSKDMPILMHGSGDVAPDQVNPDTVQLLSELTVRYISNLVDAALDAQQLLAGGQATTPPPPRYPRSRKPALPFVPDDKKKSAEDDAEDVGALLKKRPRRPDLDYWDEPLPQPKIVKRQPGPKISSPSAASRKQKLEEDEEKEPVHVDRWVGAAGVDFWEQSRSRKAYVQMPDAVGVKCFLFPICHDGFLYGKVRQIQATSRQIAPLLVDSVLLKEVQNEGALAIKHAPRRKKKEAKAKDGDADVEEEPEEEQEEETEENEPVWPGLEFLLPIHTVTDTEF